jgi:hypothetical protein
MEIATVVVATGTRTMTVYVNEMEKGKGIEKDTETGRGAGGGGETRRETGRETKARKNTERRKREDVMSGMMSSAKRIGGENTKEIAQETLAEGAETIRCCYGFSGVCAYV